MSQGAKSMKYEVNFKVIMIISNYKSNKLSEKRINLLNRAGIILLRYKSSLGNHEDWFQDHHGYRNLRVLKSLM